MRYVPIGELTDDAVVMWDAPETGEFDYIDIAAIDADVKSIVGVRRMAVSEAPGRARQVVAEGDVLVSTVRPNLNAVAIVPGNLHCAIASTGFCVLRPLPRLLDSRYLLHWARSPVFVAAMVRQATGASYPAVSDKIVRAATVPHIPLEEQRRIADVLDKADALRRKRREALALTDDLLRATFLEMFGDPVTNPRVWPVAQLGELAALTSGVTKGKDYGSEQLVERPYLRVANVQAGVLDLDEVKTIQVSESEATRYRLVAGDVLMTEGGDPDKLGRGTVWRDEIPQCIHQNHIFRARVDLTRIDPEFLSAQLGSARGQKYFARAAKQTTGIASINMTQLRAFPVLVPPVELQHRFAAAVASARRSHGSRVRALGEVDTLFASLQHRAFRGEL